MEGDNYSYWLNRGVCFRDSGKFSQALGDFNRALALQ